MELKENLKNVDINELKNEVNDLKRVNRRIGQVTDVLATIFAVSLIAKFAVTKLVKKD